MAYLKNKHLAYIKKFKLDLSKYKDGVYHDDIFVPYGIKEFKGFEELFGFEIKEVRWGLYFYKCTSLTSISNLPEKIGWDLSFNFSTSLISISKMPSVVNGNIWVADCPFFEGMTEKQIRKKYNILKKVSFNLEI